MSSGREQLPPIKTRREPVPGGSVAASLLLKVLIGGSSSLLTIRSQLTLWGLGVLAKLIKYYSVDHSFVSELVNIVKLQPV